MFLDAFFALVPQPGRATLEVGCGDGVVARALAARGHTVTGVDVALDPLRAAAAAHRAGRYVYADAAALPFEDGEFDLVVAYNALMEMADMRGAVREAVRVLAPGGHLCVCLMDRPRSPFHAFADYAPALAAAGLAIDGRYAAPGVLMLRATRSRA